MRRDHLTSHMSNPGAHITKAATTPASAVMGDPQSTSAPISSTSAHVTTGPPEWPVIEPNGQTDLQRQGQPIIETAVNGLRMDDEAMCEEVRQSSIPLFDTNGVDRQYMAACQWRRYPSPLIGL